MLRTAPGGFVRLRCMSSARSRELPTRDVTNVAWERRRRAAWIDYLRVVQESDRSEYEQVEQNAWEQLQRRLNRNDELRAAATSGALAAR